MMYATTLGQSRRGKRNALLLSLTKLHSNVGYIYKYGSVEDIAVVAV